MHSWDHLRSTNHDARRAMAVILPRTTLMDTSVQTLLHKQVLLSQRSPLPKEKGRKIIKEKESSEQTLQNKLHPSSCSTPMEILTMKIQGMPLKLLRLVGP